MKYKSNAWYNCIDDYVFPEDIELWHICPNCGLKPKIWIFDHGRSTACGCWENTYNHFSIYAESVMSVYEHDGDTVNYTTENLRNNWNHWVRTNEVLFEHAGLRDDGRW